MGFLHIYRWKEGWINGGFKCPFFWQRIRLFLITFIPVWLLGTVISNRVLDRNDGKRLRNQESYSRIKYNKSWIFICRFHFISFETFISEVNCKLETNKAPELYREIVKKVLIIVIVQTTCFTVEFDYNYHTYFQCVFFQFIKTLILWKKNTNAFVEIEQIHAIQSLRMNTSNRTSRTVCKQT